MAIVFALRADSASYTARYSLNSTEAQTMGNGVISYDTDATAITGHNINLDQGSASTRVIQYPFRGVHTAKAISVLIRMKPGQVNLLGGFWHIGQANGYSVNDLTLWQNSSLYQLIAFNDAMTTVRNGSMGVTPIADVWQDIVLTWDGTTSANKLKLYVDGVATSQTAGAAWATTTFHDTLAIGGITPGVANARFKFEEFVVWDTEIDPTSVTLESGTGSLNGASRTSLVSVSALNGGSYTDPGESSVKTGTSYTHAGVAKTGTYDGSDRWTDPGESNVKTGVSYKANSTSNNKTGTYSATCDYPTAANVRLGTSYNSGGTTGTLIVPSASDVREGVTFDATTQGTLSVEQDTVIAIAEDYESITVTVEDQA